MEKKVFLFISGILLVIVFFTSSLSAQEVEIAVDEANPPFMYKDCNTGNAVGLYPELVRAVFREIGINAQILPMPWKRTLLMGKMGKMGIAGIYKNHDRLLIFDYSDAIFDEKICIYTNKNKLFNYNELSDLNGMRIGVINGWSYGDDFDKSKEDGSFFVEGNSSDELNFKKLELGRLDCLLAIQQSGDSIIEKLNLQNDIVKLKNPVVINPTYIVFAKKTNQQELIHKFNDVVNQMKQDGSYQLLIKRIIGEDRMK